MIKSFICLSMVLFFACSSSDDVTSTFEVSVTQNPTTLEVDQIRPLTATVNETINYIDFSKESG